MRKAELLLIAGLLFFGTVTEASNFCTSLLNPSKVVSDSIRFENQKLKAIFEQGMSQESALEALKFLLDQKAFEIPTQNGFVAAAEVGDHPGNYGRFFWLRDMARVYQGKTSYVRLLKRLSQNGNLNQEIELATTEAQAMARAMVRVFEDDLFRKQALSNILIPPHHLNENDGFKNVIWIRRLLDPFVEGRAATDYELSQESNWGHKQNDALASYGLALIDAINEGRLSDNELSVKARANLALLAAYFVKIQYWNMWDVGAWEEKLALRTSSIGLVLSFLQAWRKNKDKIFDVDDLKVGFSRTEVLRVKEALEERSLDHATREGLRHIREQLDNEAVEAPLGDSFATRNEDMALFHLLWHPIEGFDLENQLKLVDRLKVLERTSGYIRYTGDWFLYGASQAALHMDKLNLNEQLAIADGSTYRVATESDLLQVVYLHEAHAYDKNTQPLVDFAGRDLEAQWTLVDSDLTSFYAKTYLSTGESDFLEKAKYHAIRMYSQVTGESSTSSEGHPILSERFPEAYIPLRIFENGKVKTIYRVSPNSPLNWSTANAIRASQLLLEAMDRSQD